MIKELQDNLVRLISKYEALVAVNKDLTEKLEKMQAEAEKAKEEINALKQINDGLKLKSAFVQSESASQEAKDKLDSLIRQIDQCIAMIG
ncbi:MAG: hypothetical protein II364_06320 [Bacteroidales bacterium]|jgi:SMC interacting uncharacterized protein involved in chromosome segregation|nr:hypothetical protein [Bacteroidales bacterium]MBQ1938561.1 hypothetical protein [Bacteroidales bacterium]